VQQAGPLDVGSLLQAAPDLRIRRGDLEPVQQGTDVQAGAADDDGPCAACAHLCDVLPCVPLVARDGGVLVDVEHVELVVRHPAPLGDGQLGGPDVHPAVQLHGVGVDHLPAEPLRERDAKVGLAGGGRADDGDDQRRHDHRQEMVA